MKPNKLIIEYEYDFTVLAIASSSKEFKLAWILNKSLQIELAKQPDISFDFLKGSRFLISNFLFESEYSSFRLLKNKAVEFENVAKPFLIPELKYCDYLLRLEGEFSEEYLQAMMQKMKDISQIQHFELLDLSGINSKENLLF